MMLYHILTIFLLSIHVLTQLKDHLSWIYDPRDILQKIENFDCSFTAVNEVFGT